MATFPTLSIEPTYPLEISYDDARIQSDIAAGYKHVRARWTRQRRKWTVSYVNITATDKNTMNTFVQITLNGGADSFTWTIPDTLTTTTVIFGDQLPTYSNEFYDGTTYRYSMSFNLIEV